MAITSHDPVPTQVLDGAVREYSRDKVYVLTALFLGAVTVIEVLTYASPDFILWKGNLKVFVLLLLMAVKFFTVAYIFMHLRFDRPLLTRVFYSGLALAVLVYVAVLSAFRIWWPGQHG
jgi:cytochrome c oxidase subunit 4